MIFRYFCVSLCYSWEKVFQDQDGSSFWVQKIGKNIKVALSDVVYCTPSALPTFMLQLLQL